MQAGCRQAQAGCRQDKGRLQVGCKWGAGRVQEGCLHLTTPPGCSPQAYFLRGSRRLSITLFLGWAPSKKFLAPQKSSFCPE